MAAVTSSARSSISMCPAPGEDRDLDVAQRLGDALGAPRGGEPVPVADQQPRSAPARARRACPAVAGCRSTAGTRRSRAATPGRPRRWSAGRRAGRIRRRRAASAGRAAARTAAPGGGARRHTGPARTRRTVSASRMSRPSRAGRPYTVWVWPSAVVATRTRPATRAAKSSGWRCGVLHDRHAAERVPDEHYRAGRARSWSAARPGRRRAGPASWTAAVSVDERPCPRASYAMIRAVSPSAVGQVGELPVPDALVKGPAVQQDDGDRCVGVAVRSRVQPDAVAQLHVDHVACRELAGPSAGYLRGCAPISYR